MLNCGERQGNKNTEESIMGKDKEPKTFSILSYSRKHSVHNLFYAEA